MKYPEEIYKNRAEHPMTKKQVKLSGWARERAYNLGHDTGYWKGYEAGKANPLEGYSNLTAAISAGDPIDWERLDGLVAKCVHPTLGDLLYTLEVDGNGRKVIWKDEGNFWFTTNGGSVWAEALMKAWHGRDGWTLYVEGAIPTRHKTADQLEIGTYFLGKAHNDSSCLAYVGHPLTSDTVKTIYYAPEMLKAITPATEWEVLEEYGPFQKPEENKK